MDPFLQVALQFPDSLLHDAARVAALLAQETSELVFILGDTSYGRYTRGWQGSNKVSRLLVPKVF